MSLFCWCADVYMQKNRYLWQIMPVDSLRIDVQMNLSSMACCRATPYYIIIGSADSLLSV